MSHGRRGASRSHVTVWKLDVLPGSETFVRNQIEAMTRWEATLLGSVRTRSAISAPSDRVVFGNSLRDRSGLWWAAVTGRSRQVEEALRRTNPDVVHAHFGKDAWMVARAAKALRVPLVVTVHGYDVSAVPSASGWTGIVARYRLRRVFARADAIVAVSQYIRDRALCWGADPAKTQVLSIGVPVESAPPPPRETEWDVLFVGRLVGKKGALDLVEAVGFVSRNRSVRCGFVGDGPLRTAVERRAAELGVDAVFLGALPPHEVRRHLSATRVFAGPSRTAPDGDVEGLGMVFLEAAVAGVPVVAYAHGGVPEAVEDGVTGLLAPEGDIETLARHLGHLLDGADLRHRMGARARERVRELFDIERCTVELEALYDRVSVDAGQRRARRIEKPAIRPTVR